MTTNILESSAKLPIGKVAKLQGVTPRTIDRWLRKEAVAFPRPIYINGRKYWRIADLEKWDSDAS